MQSQRDIVLKYSIPISYFLSYTLAPIFKYENKHELGQFLPRITKTCWTRKRARTSYT